MALCFYGSASILLLGHLLMSLSHSTLSLPIPLFGFPAQPYSACLQDKSAFIINLWEQQKFPVHRRIIPEQFPPYTVWFLGKKLRLSGMVASAFTH